MLSGLIVAESRQPGKRPTAAETGAETTTACVGRLLLRQRLELGGRHAFDERAIGLLLQVFLAAHIEQVARPLGFGLEVELVVRIGRDDEWNAIDDDDRRSWRR